MGVDAEMYWRLEAKVSADWVLAEARELAEAFGVDNFLIDRGEGAHCLCLVDVVWDYDPDEPLAAGNVVRVRLFGRYYSPGYERGNLPLYLSIAKYLRARQPGSAVFYGGDSGGVEQDELTPAREDELWAHFVANGHRPYFGFFEVGMVAMGGAGDGFKPPDTCSLCRVTMTRFGFGPSGSGYGAFSCLGCGYSVETLDGGKTYAESVKK